MYTHIHNLYIYLYVYLKVVRKCLGCQVGRAPSWITGILLYLKTVFAELQSKINFLARNKVYIVKIYNDTRDTNI
jgi:hypothetical protein